MARRADVVTANLTAAVLIAHAARLRALVAPGGALIVSGFSSAEQPDVVRAFGLELAENGAKATGLPRCSAADDNSGGPYSQSSRTDRDRGDRHRVGAERQWPEAHRQRATRSRQIDLLCRPPSLGPHEQVTCDGAG